MSVNVPWDSGYSMLFIGGLSIWFGAPVLNSMFNTSIMASYITLPMIGSHPMNVIVGGAIMLVGLLSYLEFRL